MSSYAKMNYSKKVYAKVVGSIVTVLFVILTMLIITTHTYAADEHYLGFKTDRIVFSPQSTEKLSDYVVSDINLDAYSSVISKVTIDDTDKFFYDNGTIAALDEGTSILTIGVNYPYNNSYRFLKASVMLISTSESVETKSIVLDKDDFTLQKGKSILVSTTLAPENATDNKLIWSSSNTNAVTVNDGLIKAVGTGSSTVTVALESNPEVKATCEVTVVNPLQEITVEKPYRILLGETQQLQYSLIPSDAEDVDLIFTSSDPSIVSVDGNGLMSAHKNGNVQITIASGNIHKTVDVRVCEYKPLTGFTLDQTFVKCEAGKNFQLSPLFEPEDTSETLVSWVSDNPSIADVDDNGLVSTYESGIATITASAGEYTAECTVVCTPNADLAGLAITDSNTAPSPLIDKGDKHTNDLWVGFDPVFSSATTEYVSRIYNGRKEFLNVWVAPKDYNAKVKVYPADNVGNDLIYTNDDGTILDKGSIGEMRFPVYFIKGKCYAKIKIVVEGQKTYNVTLIRSGDTIDVGKAPLVINTGGYSDNIFQVVALCNEKDVTTKCMWYSSDSDIVDIDAKGIVTVKCQEGEAAIWAIYGAQSTRKNPLKLTVKDGKISDYHIADKEVDEYNDALIESFVKEKAIVDANNLLNEMDTFTNDPNEPEYYTVESYTAFDLAKSELSMIIENSDAYDSSAIRAAIDKLRFAYSSLVIITPTIIDPPVVISPAPNPMRVKPTKKTLKIKLKTIRKKSKTVKPFTVTNHKGKVSYKVTYKGKAKKYLKFKNGKLTIKKGTKKGKYIATVKVTASGNKYFKKASKNCKITVVVK